MPSRRQFLVGSAAVAASLIARRALPAEAPLAITVYKDPACECCARWVKHLSAHGFVVAARDVGNVDDIKRTMNVPPALQSCHTAVIGRYVVEGHVPADLIRRFVTEKSSWAGLAVPGMPNGSPGMEDGRTDPYTVVAFDRSGKTRAYATR